MASRYLHVRDWLVVLVVQLCLVRSSADYVWDGSEWKWQVSTNNQTCAELLELDNMHTKLFFFYKSVVARSNG